jgi:hypothetical protein
VRFPSLNGWQRLWVVVSVMMLIPVGFVAADFLPSEKDAIDVVVAELGRRGPIDLFEILALENLAKGIPVRESEAQLNEKSSGPKVKLDEAQIQRLYNEARSTRLKKIAFVTIVAALAWVMAAALVYGLGWSVAWVIRGFRGNAL